MIDNSTVQYTGGAPRGWCAGCGRRLTRDGRCSNCDAWWASPLVGVGGPLLLVILVALGVGIWWLNRSNSPASVPGGALPAASAPAAFRPVFATETASDSLWDDPGSKVPRDKPVPPRPISRAEQIRLRQWSDHVDAIIAADDAARQQQSAPARPNEPTGGGGFGAN